MVISTTLRIVIVKNLIEGTITINKRYRIGTISKGNRDSGFFATFWTNVMKALAVGTAILRVISDSIFGSAEVAIAPFILSAVANNYYTSQVLAIGTEFILTN
jgi:hypothetical protein